MEVHHQSVPLLSARESVIVAMDASKSKGSVDALDWALKHVVRPRDRVVVLGVLCEFGKKTTFCFPLIGGIGISGIWERLEFSGEVKPREVEEELEKKKEQYQSILQPFYRQCKKNEVKLEVKLAAGYCPAQITIQEARHSNSRWIVLDSNFKRFKLVIYEHVGCNLAVLKGNDVATLIASQDLLVENSPANDKRTTDGAELNACRQTDNLQNACPITTIYPNKCSAIGHEGEPSTSVPGQSSCWNLLSQRRGYPRAFTRRELEVITNGFSEENIVLDTNELKAYEGILLGTLVLVKSFLGNDDCFWSTLRILAQARHRNIMNLVGYCCNDTCRFLIFDYTCLTLEMALQCDDQARDLSWQRRWYIALEIGGSLRYLHEECVGVIAHLSVCSSHIAFFHSSGCCTMLGNFVTARWIKDNIVCDEDSPGACTNVEEEECLSIDVRDYGKLLIELISGKSALLFQNQSEGQSLIDWALPLLENDSLREVMDSRLMDSDDMGVVRYMARAALLCLKNDPGHRFSMSKALAMVRGDQLAVPKCYP